MQHDKAITLKKEIVEAENLGPFACQAKPAFSSKFVSTKP